jgi:hypothetical protein
MEYLWIIAIIAGCIVASFRLSIGSKFDEILVVIRSLQFLNRSKFEAYYSIVDGKWLRERNPDFVPIHMIYLQEDGLVGSYEEYVAMCKKAQPRIYDIFHRYLIHAIKDVILYVLPVILLPAVLFWQYWYFYLMGVALYFLYMLITDALGWFVRADEVINRSQDALLLAAFKKYLESK